VTGTLDLGLPVAIDGSASDLRPSVWISSLDVLAAGGRIEATIRGVFRHARATMPDGSILRDCPALHFEEHDVKPLVLTAAANLGPLISAFGNVVGRWSGRRVVLFNERTKRDGVPCLGVRVRKLREDER